jgi:uncharacterized sulfatase
MVSPVDVLPTFVEAAGGEPDQALDGRSILPVLLGSKSEHRGFIPFTHTNIGTIKGSLYPMRGIRTRTHKYIRNLNPEGTFRNVVTEGRPERPGIDQDHFWQSWKDLARRDQSVARRVAWVQKRPAEELYDLSEDPYELNNLALETSLSGVRRQLSAQLDSWMAAQGDRGIAASRGGPVEPMSPHAAPDPGL